MEIDEIIKTLDIAKSEVEWNYPLDYHIAISEAIKMLKKEVAGEPFFNKKYDAHLCPNCKCMIGFGDNYCSNCGKKITWM